MTQAWQNALDFWAPAWKLPVIFISFKTSRAATCMVPQGYSSIHWTLGISKLPERLPSSWDPWMRPWRSNFKCLTSLLGQWCLTHFRILKFWKNNKKTSLRKCNFFTFNRKKTFDGDCFTGISLSWRSSCPLQWWPPKHPSAFRARTHLPANLKTNRRSLDHCNFNHLQPVTWTGTGTD